MKRIFFISVAVAAILLMAPARLTAAIDILVDDRYDSSGFFAPGSDARNTLEVAISFFEALLDDDLTAIESDSTNRFDIHLLQPDTIQWVTIEDFDVPADTLFLFVGALDLPGTTLGAAGPGRWDSPSEDQEWLDNATTRGQGTVADTTGDTAIDFAPWGGIMTIDSGTIWNYRASEMPDQGETDLYTVFLHELGHLLGIGLSDSWKNLLEDESFIGTHSMAVHGGPVPLQPVIKKHWAGGTTSQIYGGSLSQEVSMAPSVNKGDRKLYTDLDVAGLDDIGWDTKRPAIWEPAGDGAYGDLANWSIGEKPTTDDIVCFDGNGAHTVSFSAEESVCRVFIEKADVTLDLGGNRFTVDFLEAMDPGATLTIQNGTLQLRSYASLTHHESLRVGNGGMLQLDGVVNNTVVLGEGGTLTGTGTIKGSVTGSGCVSPGDSVGTLKVEGDCASDRIFIELAGTTQDVNYDLLSVDGLCWLDNELEIVLQDGFVPSLGDQFTIIQYGDRSGVFNTLAGISLPNGLILMPDYGPNAVTLWATTIGDVTFDGLVDMDDARVLAEHWLQTTAGPFLQGDLNGDGFVDDLDASILAANWGTEPLQPAVPEPSALLLALGALATWRFRPRRATNSAANCDLG
ncbi:MAG: hypothetical protein JW818_14995 [Pirellulales bacterium]|nr:hypothetical protein [Pirellulales bacterium]